MMTAIKKLQLVTMVGLVTSCAIDDTEPTELEVSEDTSPISGGTNDTSTPATNATVKVGGGCSGTLIRPDVVLTAGHCIGGREQPPACDPGPDWQEPGAWYPFTCGSSVTVKLGIDAAGLWSTATAIGANETFRIDHVDSTTPLQSGDYITLRTANGHYVVAEGGGGQYVGADRSWAAEWETFQIQLLVDSGPIGDGAWVALRSASGQFVREVSGGGLRADVLNTSSTATWLRVRRIAGAGQVTDNDQIALQALDGQHWTAINGGGGGYIHSAVADQYSLPVNRDILMLKLTAPVPASIATPLELVHRMPARSFGTSTRWHDWFCIGSEICGTGDFNGDGRDDVITFTRGTSGHAFVGRSTGAAFTSSLWSSGTCTGSQECRTGDFNGDGRDDVLSLDLSTGRAYVRLSTGSSFGASVEWGANVCFAEEVCAVGDVDHDGRDDVVVFFRSVYGGAAVGDVYVTRSTGSGFGAFTKWHDSFCIGNEECRVGDFDGDGRDDIATFLRDTVADPGRGDVYVARSSGTSFGAGQRWHDFFCIGSEVCDVGDFNGDGTDDIVTFLRGTAGDVYVGISNGSNFGPGNVWNGTFCLDSQVCKTGDFDGDGRDDIASFVRDTRTDATRGDVNISRAIAPATVDAFLAGQRFGIAGWGYLDPATNELPAVRQTGLVDYDHYGSWYDSLHAIVVRAYDGSISQVGDSGGPLKMWDSHKQRHVNLGATQSVDEVSLAAYTITFRPGGHLDAWVRKALDID